ncbi:uncharacterized protein GGS22DRAFT_152228 [Annulohypoxylon maeteangense]|uniref:uncharacterized protein n=1 Tax=Annulohypoxylon maeteangense TaxID=1927788 RepID=UPI00200815F4|nr:uncharacterized protein GGS22DRAFT_152228 [Annulohypoxylon maeteangense]KAI0888729.1 hypothetical protein GGS22DRAFT_152228 [Annulohypoxylon maeteangense]
MPLVLASLGWWPIIGCIMVNWSVSRVYGLLSYIGQVEVVWGAHDTYPTYSGSIIFAIFLCAAHGMIPRISVSSL